MIAPSCPVYFLAVQNNIDENILESKQKFKIFLKTEATSA